MGAPASPAAALAGRRVLVTGHTGFKGSWLVRWLLDAGAEVSGYALAPDTKPSLFEELRLAREIDHVESDIRDASRFAATVARVRPELVIHLAAQPLVRRSYLLPHLTFDTNAMGVVNLFEAVRGCQSVRGVINITTDKVYANTETGRAYTEEEALGGLDPYSASKACSELITGSYRASFLARSGVLVASARAGNVLGGGDWAQDRLLPDCVRALTAGEAIVIRNPGSVRPWTHVLEPLAGYLALAARLLDGDTGVARAFNFGPRPEDEMRVSEIVETAIDAWGGGRWEARTLAEAPHEAGLLHLDSTLASRELGWRPAWSTQAAVTAAMSWYRAFADGIPAENLVRADIAAYEAAADRSKR